MSEKEFSNEFCKYVFTEEEKKEIAAEMARKVAEVTQLEDQKAAMMSDYGGRIKIASEQVKGAAVKLNNGYEMKSVKCEVARDYKKKVVRWIRTDNDEVAKERHMTADELQRELFE